MSKDRVWINPKTYHVLGDTWSDWIRYPLKTYETQKSLKKGWTHPKNSNRKSCWGDFLPHPEAGSVCATVDVWRRRNQKDWPLVKGPASAGA